MTISDKTKIGLFSALGAIPVIVSAVYFTASWSFKSEARVDVLEAKMEISEKVNDKQDQRQEAIMNILVDIQKKVSTLEERSQHRSN